MTDALLRLHPSKAGTFLEFIANRANRSSNALLKNPAPSERTALVTYLEASMGRR